MILRQFLSKIRLTSDKIYTTYLIKNHQGKNLSYDEWMEIINKAKNLPA